MTFDRHGKLEITNMNYDPDRPASGRPVKIQDLTFRDGHQSLFATRGRTEDMLIIAGEIDKVGFYSMEVWGGATFDTTHRYLNEDPWERLKTLKKHIVKTPFSMLLRGQNLVGYRNYPDDVVEAFVQRACDNGIDIFRVFDALNDFRNFQTAVKIIKKNKKHFQGTICYSLTEPRMGGDVYTLEYYLEKAKALEEMGADSICIKDMAGLIAPYDAYNLIRALKEKVSLPIHLHTHFTSGMADLSLMKAVEAGVDIIDTCLAPFAYRSSHPAIEPLVVSLWGTNRDTGLDINRLVRLGEELEKIIPKYRHFENKTRFSIIDPNVILHQTPGGMLSNLVNQLKQMGELDKLEKVFEALPRVRKDLGQVPLVTPTSQIVGTQTVNNVLFDSGSEQYTKITQQVKDLCYGLYGQTPRPLNKELQKKALKDYLRGQEPITVRPGETLEAEMETAKRHIKDLAKNVDDLLIFAMFPVTGRRFLNWKYGLEEPPKEVKAKSIEDVQNENNLIEKALSGKLEEKTERQVLPKPDSVRAFDVYVDGEYYKVEVNEAGMPSGLRQNADAFATGAAAPSVSPNKQAFQAPSLEKHEAKKQQGVGERAVLSPMPGMIISYEKKVGDPVKKGETIAIVEAMKMHNNIEAICDVIIGEILFKEGDSVAKEDILCIIKED